MNCGIGLVENPHGSSMNKCSEGQGAGHRMRDKESANKAQLRIQ